MEAEACGAVETELRRPVAQAGATKGPAHKRRRRSARWTKKRLLVVVVSLFFSPGFGGSGVFPKSSVRATVSSTYFSL
jgi:hypothetical protein